ncbi:MAG: hypothetical protein GEU83_18470 [Pseudonocardiaceae bacterium]|nr:hypothetical protein [Pseudonocardiaceae bacterium]
MNAPAATEYADEYVHWTERVRATYEAISYTCHHRLGDHQLAERVAVQVVAGLVARPGVFRYFGLPYSGRIAKLAEKRIAEAQQGRLAAVGDWDELRDSLDEVTAAHQEVFVLTCVRGCDDEEVAATLGCDPVAAAGRRDATMALMRHIATPHLSGIAAAEMRS